MLTDASIEGKIDRLLGLKENVIIGKLIPAATGLKRYRGIEIGPPRRCPRPRTRGPRRRRSCSRRSRRSAPTAAGSTSSRSASTSAASRAPTTTTLARRGRGDRDPRGRLAPRRASNVREVGWRAAEAALRLLRATPFSVRRLLLLLCLCAVAAGFAPARAGAVDACGRPTGGARLDRLRAAGVGEHLRPTGVRSRSPAATSRPRCAQPRRKDGLLGHVPQPPGRDSDRAGRPGARSRRPTASSTTPRRRRPARRRGSRSTSSSAPACPRRGRTERAVPRERPRFRRRRSRRAAPDRSSSSTASRTWAAKPRPGGAGRRGLGHRARGLLQRGSSTAGAARRRTGRCARRSAAALHAFTDIGIPPQGSV